MKNLDFLLKTRYTHRGLHDNKNIPENSLIAFQKAIDNSYGIEFDVYLTDDNNLIIHHDLYLKRSCGKNITAYKVNTSSLEDYKLFGTNHSIPLLKDMLSLVNGRVPLILEIKSTNKVEQTCKAIYDMIKDYKGDICVESFDTRIVNWWYLHHREIVLGQLYGDALFEITYKKLKKQCDKVDFLAVSNNHLKDRYFAKVKAKYPFKLIINWVVKTKHDLKNAKQYADNYIFEYNGKDSKYVTLDDINCRD